MAKIASELTEKQRRFVDEYLADLNGKQAAIRCGYSEKTAEQQASRLLSNVKVKEAVSLKQKILSERLNISAERVLQEYAKIAFSNMRDFVNWDNGAIAIRPASELSDEQTACVAEISDTPSQFGSKIKIKLHDKLSALDSIARHLGMFKDKLEVSGKDGKPIQTVELQMTPQEAAQLYLENLKK